MKIDIDHVAKLANLPITEAEKTKFQPQLEKIVEFIEKLSELDTENVEPTFQVTGKVNELRADEPRGLLSQAEVLQNAPQKEDDFIVTKGVFESE
jgi:aspartyl-tRNA(Asn)/glutamyl-tRNA(Gln) amidotransferase subunit C